MIESHDAVALYHQRTLCFTGRDQYQIGICEPVSNHIWNLPFLHNVGKTCVTYCTPDERSSHHIVCHSIPVLYRGTRSVQIGRKPHSGAEQCQEGVEHVDCSPVGGFYHTFWKKGITLWIHVWHATCFFEMLARASRAWWPAMAPEAAVRQERGWSLVSSRSQNALHDLLLPDERQGARRPRVRRQAFGLPRNGNQGVLSTTPIRHSHICLSLAPKRRMSRQHPCVHHL